MEKLKSCMCSECVSLCERNPGWMIPEEASTAISRGFGSKLMRDWLEPDEKVGNEERVYVLAPASSGCCGQDAPEFDFFDFIPGFTGGELPIKGRCVLLSKDRKCEIHNSGFKPLQCRKNIGCATNENHVDNYDVARLWHNVTAQNIVKRWQENEEINEST